MRKFLLSILFFVFACANAWGDGSPWTCGNVTVDLTGTTLTISPISSTNGRMSDLLQEETNWRTLVNRGNVRTIIIEDGVKYIGAYAFYYCTAITSITIPTSVEGFGEKAFLSSNGCHKIYYAGTPNQWAQIDFTITESGGKYYPYSHPFYGSTSSNKFYFYGESTITNAIVLTPGITEVKPYAFYNATGCTGVNIPSTVTTIGKCAFAVYSYHSSDPKWIAINKSSAPSTVASDAFKTGVTIYVPNGNTGYTGSPWSSFTVTPQPVDGDCTMSSGSASWVLGADGVLTITGHGEIASYASSGAYGWAYFRRLVHKIVIQGDASGDLTSLGNVLKWNWAATEVTISQTTIPTSNVFGGNSTTGTSFINTHDNVTLKIKSASLADESASNLAADPWNNEKLDIQLSDNLVIGDNNANNSTVLANCSTYVEAPITLQLNRSLTNAQYNTFCSPIALTAEQLNDADIRELESSSLDGEDLTLTFSASSLDNIVAGQPYLVKPSSELANPTFTNIAPNSLVSTTTNTETEYVDFIGVLAPTPLTGGNKNTLFLGEGNELFWPEADGNIGGMRAYFSIKGDAQKAAKRARIVMNPEVATGVENGVLMNGENGVSHKILRDGQIIIIRDGKEYNVMGIMMK